jgi:hypothetical protein
MSYLADYYNIGYSPAQLWLSENYWKVWQKQKYLQFEKSYLWNQSFYYFDEIRF